VTSTQIIFAVFLAAVFPTITGLVGIILARRESSDLRAEVRSDLRDIRVEMTGIRERLATLEAK
jgi:hypothetical protein